MAGRCLVLVALLLVSLSAAPAAPQTADKPGTPTFGETVEVRLVNVETVVVDAANQPVRGLTKADFRLLVDGVEVPIDHFDEIVEPSAARAASAAPGPGACPAIARTCR